MRLVIGKETTEFDNNETGIKHLIETVESKAATVEGIFSHLIVDGVAVFDNYAEYLEQNIASIKVVETQFLTISEFILSILVSTSEYLQRAIPAVEQLAGNFYSQADAEVWQQTDQLIEGIQWLQESFTAMDKLPNLAGIMRDYEQWNLYSQALSELVERVTALNEPLDSADYVSVSDILLYEIKPALEKLMANLSPLIQAEDW